MSHDNVITIIKINSFVPGDLYMQMVNITNNNNAKSKRVSSFVSYLMTE